MLVSLARCSIKLSSYGCMSLLLCSFDVDIFRKLVEPERYFGFRILA